MQWQEHLQCDQCLPAGRDCSFWVQSRISGGRKLGKASTPGAGWERKAAISLLVCADIAYPTDSHCVSLAPNPMLPSCAASPQVAGSAPACCPLLITSVLEFHQKDINWQKKKARSLQRVQSREGCVVNTVFAHFRGDAGFRVILESIGVMTRRDIFRSVLTISSAFCFILLSLVYYSLVQVIFIKEKLFRRKLGALGQPGFRRNRHRTGVFPNAMKQSILEWSNTSSFSVHGRIGSRIDKSRDF